MYTRLAAYLILAFILALSWTAWGQDSETTGTIFSATFETDGDSGGVTSWKDEIPGGGVTVALFIYFFIALIAFLGTSLWILFVKADQPGWACLIPIYQWIVLLQISGKPWWWLLLYFIPVVGFVIAIIQMIALAEAFGKGAGYGIGLVFLGFIFLPLLAFGDAEYSGGGWEGA